MYILYLLDIYIYISIYIYVYKCICAHTHTQTHIHPNAHTYIPTHARGTTEAAQFCVTVCHSVFGYFAICVAVCVAGSMCCSVCCREYGCMCCSVLQSVLVVRGSVMISVCCSSWVRDDFSVRWMYWMSRALLDLDDRVRYI